MDDFFCYCGSCGELTLHRIITFNPVDIRCAVCGGEYKGESPPPGTLQELMRKMWEKVAPEKSSPLLFRSG